ncbi:MAG TPA: hypothetical protein VNN19_01500 [bacterium]|nr:hypothetical protein [bacterium]
MTDKSKFDYRQWLIKADYEASQAYDKTVLTLAAGALGISFAFIKDIVPSPKPETMRLLLWGWSAFGFSLLATLISLLTSQFALRTAMVQYDQKRTSERPGRWWSILTSGLSIASGLAFVIGVILLVFFATGNLGGVGNQ